ncbi:MAG: glycosyltransferase family 2 protein [Elusimicrobiota bacterium]|jgi:glycosyltransferase involved in cell wall biosynthesis
MKLDGLSLFFPCHNEETNVERVIDEASQVAAQVAESYEVIIVDDGSCDRTPEIVQSMAQSRPALKLVRHPTNRGYGEALKSGFRAARFPWVFYSDGDGQFDLNELPSLVELTSQADIISGVRVRRADPWHRKLNAQIFAAALRVFMGLDIPDIDCAFKLYRRSLFNEIQMITTGALIDAEILVKARRMGYRIATVGVSHRPRRAGVQSGANLSVIFRAMKEFWALWWDLRTYGKRVPV